MKRRKPPAATPQGDLFGRPKDPPKDTTPVTILMDVIPASCTDRAWFIRPRGVSSAAFGFVPKSEAKRGASPREDEFTLPRWLARERGWL